MADRAGDRPPADIDRPRDLAAALARLLVAAYLAAPVDHTSQAPTGR